MSNEIKECPFCGNNVSSDKDHKKNCWVLLMWSKLEDLIDIPNERLLSAWNTRPIEDDLRKLLEEAKAREERYTWALRTIRKTAKAQETTACRYICAIIGDSGLPDEWSESK